MKLSGLSLLLLQAAFASREERRVIGFHVDNADWQFYDWKALTTISSFSPSIDPEMVKVAHAHNVRVTMSAPLQPEHIRSSASRAEWIADKVQTIQNFSLDGINIDIEKKFFERKALTALTQETSQAVKKVCANCTVAFDLAAFTWFDAFYDFKGIAEASDYVVLMAYDMMALQPYAAPNTPFPRMQEVTAGFLKAGVPRSKLILGLPWYGYDFPCSRGVILDKCLYDWPIDEPAHQRGFTDLLLKSKHSSLQPSAVTRDDKLNSWKFRYEGNDGKHGNTRVHEVWFDDAVTLMDKMSYAGAEMLGGVAIWDLNSVVYNSTDPAIANSTRALWSGLAEYRHGSLMGVMV